MLFNSFIFMIFFAIIYLAYIFLKKNHKWQNHLLLLGSYVFYGWWNWRFLFLLSTTTLLDFMIARKMDSEINSKQRKLLLIASISINLAVLGFFKYFNFFSESFVNLLNTVGLTADPLTLKIILPVGISFYTFQAMSYTIDVYRKKIRASKNILEFALFISFFPQLVAGPIERATNLLPQIQKPRTIRSEQIYAGLFLIIWGYFKKLVIADNVGLVADRIFNNYSEFYGFDLFLGVLAFAVQIYCDFSAYSDIARGIAKFLGFDLMINFKLPYFALNPSDFWNRWHISLSSWLRDYLYIPLGGNRKGQASTCANLFLTMSLGGLWHGAAWNFILWGMFQGIILIIYRIFKKGKYCLLSQCKSSSYLITGLKLATMLFITLTGWMIFRSASISQIIYFLKNTGFNFSEMTYGFILAIIFYSLPLAVMQFWQHKKKDLLIITKLPVPAIASAYVFMIVWILIFGARNSVEFIYFQF